MKQPHTHEVFSQSGRRYEVHGAAEGCSCPDDRKRGGECKRLRRVRQENDRDPERWQAVTSELAAAILGLQSLSQLAQQYDSATVDALLSGLTQEVFLQCGDERTVEYVRDRIGATDSVTQTIDRTGAPDGRDVKTSVTRTPLQAKLQQIADGEGIIYATRGWIHTRVPMWCDLDAPTQSALIGSRQPDRNDRSPSRPVHSPGD